MARYRSKTEDELDWNFIRRRLTRQFDTEMMNFREATLNKLLTSAFDKYSKALERGEKLVVEESISAWVTDAMASVMESPIKEIEDLGAPDND